MGNSLFVRSFFITSIREWSTFAHDANAVISEFEMRAGHFDLGHMATGAISTANFASARVAIFASGPKAYLVHDSMEQNWIYHVMRDAFGF